VVDLRPVDNRVSVKNRVMGRLAMSLGELGQHRRDAQVIGASFVMGERQS